MALMFELFSVCQPLGAFESDILVSDQWIIDHILCVDLNAMTWVTLMVINSDIDSVC